MKTPPLPRGNRKENCGTSTCAHARGPVAKLFASRQPNVGGLEVIEPEV